MSLRRTRHALPEKLPSWGVAVLESHHAPDWTMEWRRHPFLKVVFALAGQGDMEVAGKRFPFLAGDLIIVPPERRNRIVDAPEEPSSLYVLCVTPTLLDFDRGVLRRLTAGRAERSGYLANRAEALFRRLLFQQSHGGAGAGIAMVASALELLALLLEPPQEPADDAGAARQEVRRYVGRLDTHFFEATTIDEAARRLGLSRRRFTQLFKEVTGQAWLAYVHERAIEHAARLLAETEASITSIAFECGFGDLSTFYRRFKSLRGVSPGEWRRQTKPLSPKEVGAR
ncbi:HTH-type transcriptional activator Btr [Botrimarina colliarenosi]|uniref:HTH-type transcriptional activator Btr n=1 Tax=Botrimarina colliarenosi TaxID=2528001 RepID=A0A5C6ADL0_9BACT|nr:AraC family transcriptional regulator [Botrimarina colliarenosi]TWT98142.1 HTH-type transcriptional activator Btr [Botrimarina colliarenosi]